MTNKRTTFLNFFNQKEDVQVEGDLTIYSQKELRDIETNLEVRFDEYTKENFFKDIEFTKEFNPEKISNNENVKVSPKDLDKQEVIDDKKRKQELILEDKRTRKELAKQEAITDKKRKQELILEDKANRKELANQQSIVEKKKEQDLILEDKRTRKELAKQEAIAEKKRKQEFIIELKKENELKKQQIKTEREKRSGLSDNKLRESNELLKRQLEIQKQLGKELKVKIKYQKDVQNQLLDEIKKNKNNKQNAVNLLESDSEKIIKRLTQENKKSLDILNKLETRNNSFDKSTINKNEQVAFEKHRHAVIDYLNKSRDEYTDTVSKIYSQTLSKIDEKTTVIEKKQVAKTPIVKKEVLTFNKQKVNLNDKDLEKLIDKMDAMLNDVDKMNYFFKK